MGHRQLDGGAVGQVVDRLHHALAVGLLAQDDALAGILDRAGEDLRCGGAVAIHQDHQRDLHLIFAVRGVLRLVSVPGLHIEDQALRDDLIGDAGHHVDLAAGVAAKIQDQRLNALIIEIGERILELVRRHLGELRQGQIPDAGILIGDLRAHHLLADRVAGDGDLQIVRLTGAGDRQGDVRAHLAAHLRDHLVGAHAGAVLPVDLVDDVVLAKARLLGRGVVDDAGDLGIAGGLVRADPGADATEDALEAGGELLHLIRGVVLGVGIAQGFQQALVEAVLLGGHLHGVRLIVVLLDQALQLFELGDRGAVDRRVPRGEENARPEKCRHQGAEDKGPAENADEKSQGKPLSSRLFLLFRRLSRTARCGRRILRVRFLWCGGFHLLSSLRPGSSRPFNLLLWLLRIPGTARGSRTGRLSAPRSAGGVLWSCRCCQRLRSGSPPSPTALGRHRVRRRACRW